MSGAFSIFRRICLLNVFEAVKQSVTTRQAAEHYGIRVGRNGMCVCPFHDDKNPSMKVDRRFHCFGCQADGDVIDFVSRLENISPKEAALMLAQDFSIPYEDKEPPGRSRRPQPRQESPEQQFKRMERHCFRVLSDYHNLLRRWKRDYAPKTPEEEWHPLFVEALQKQSHVEYLLDVLLFSDIGERAALIASYGKEVRNLERRMADLAARTAAGRDGHHRSRTPAPER
jgi:DNA primase (bacterial type)